MKKLEIKHVRLIYDEWKCIERKSYRQKRIKNPDFSGFLALIDIEKVKEKQVWSWGRESLTVHGMRKCMKNTRQRQMTWTFCCL